MLYSFVIKRCVNGLWVYCEGLRGWDLCWTPDVSKAEQYTSYEAAENEITEGTDDDFPHGLYQIEKIFTKK